MGNQWSTGHDLTNTDNFGTGMTTGNSESMGNVPTVNNGLIVEEPGCCRKPWYVEPADGFQQRIPSGSDPTGWQSIDGSQQNGFQSGIQSINNGLPSPTSSSGSPFGLNLPPWAGKRNKLK
ncbi:hypothetical protein DPMN_081181 [Dreissena polymorpha]|uniref:Uncharacterized protein n=1 Tax=Dreissena polymorpha TaxID=45954 RepID=A0A9D4B8Z4_DREPO|nr:hypothetical protein DPMN_081181 [Dreissena polymorpha]